MYWSIEDSFKLNANGNIVIVGGTHGAGKSTLCLELKSFLKWDYLSPQEIEHVNGLDSKKAIYRFLLKAVRGKLSLGESFIFEHIMSGHFIDKLLAEAEKAGFKCHLVFLDIENSDLALDRVGLRVKEGGHDVEIQKVSERLKESRYNFWFKYRKVCESWFLFDNSLKSRRLISKFDVETGIKIFSDKDHDIFKNRIES